MGDFSGDAQWELASIIERISTVVRKDQQARQVADEKEIAAIDAALAFLPELKPDTLQALNRELARTDTIATSGIFNFGLSGGPGAAQFVRRYCSPPSSHPLAPHSAAGVDARLNDMLLFRDILRAHSNTMFFRCLTRVKDILGLGAEDSLAREGADKYGARGVVLLLNTAHSLAEFQLRKTSAHITPSMGYAGMDAWADAQDDCHFMTAELAQWILRHLPRSAEFASLVKQRRLDAFRISPSDLEPEPLLAELSKVDIDALAFDLARWNGMEEDSRGVGGRADRWKSLQNLSDRGERSFDVQGVSGPKTVGDAWEAHIWLRQSKQAAGQLKAFYWIMGSLGIPALAFVVFWPMVLQLLTLGSSRAWLGVLTFVLAELLGGTLLAMGAVSLLDMRTSGFFTLARAMTKLTVLQGRRTPEFQAALHELRPAMFRGNRSGGVPKYFEMCFNQEGALLIGGGRLPDIIATFPWDTVRFIGGGSETTASRKSTDDIHEVVLRIDHHGNEVKLAFPLERAKVAWTTRRYLEKKPIDAAIGIIQGLRSLSLKGIPLSSSDWSRPQAQIAATRLAERRKQVRRGLAAAAFICFSGPLILVLFLR